MSDGEGIDIDNDDIPALTTNKIASKSNLPKAKGTDVTHIRNPKCLPKKAELPPRSATKMLANQLLVVKNPTDDKTITIAPTPRRTCERILNHSWLWLWLWQ